MDVVRLEKVAKIAVYVPPNALPWDDAVTLALEYAEIPFDKLWDEEVLTGLENIYAESSVDYPTISYEDITVKNPASILLPYDTTKIDKLKVEEDEISKSLSSTEAIKKNNFIVVDNNVVFRPGPRVIDAIKIIRRLTKSYDGVHNVLENLDLIIERGEKIALVGVNGAGKSTFTRIIAGIDPDYKGVVKEGHLVGKKFYAQNQADELSGDMTVLATMEDAITGGTSTSANVTQANNLGTYNTGSKIGYNVGALIYTRLFDSFQFSTGLDFAGKNFEVTPPSNVNTGTPGANTRIDSTTQKVANNYMNIPLNFNFGGMVTDKLGFTFNGGPYLGILLSTDDKSGMGYKNFDFGLVGSLTANYKIAPLTSVLLGAKYEYGGLNNLGNTPYVDRVSTSSLGFFTGIRLAID
ncbi:unnamed protein product [Rotaria sp. Silwood1]|nr:unnamed protein product [Rotaria sp. Silwood1]